MLDHGIVHVLVRSHFNGLILSIIVHHSWVFGMTVLSHKNIEKRIVYTILSLVKALGHRFRRITVLCVKDHSQFGTSFVNVFVFEVLGVSKNEYLSEKGVSIYGILVLSCADDGPPPPPGNI